MQPIESAHPSHSISSTCAATLALHSTIEPHDIGTLTCAVAAQIPPAPLCQRGDVSPQVLCTNLVWSDLGRRICTARGLSNLGSVVNSICRRRIGGGSLGAPRELSKNAGVPVIRRYNPRKRPGRIKRDEVLFEVVRGIDGVQVHRADAVGSQPGITHALSYLVALVL